MRVKRLAMVLAVVALVGCSSDDGVLAPPSPTPAPEANSPQGVLRRLEWALRNRSIEVYRELFTADYRFVFAALDSSGNAFRANPFDRDDELACATSLFQSAEIRIDLDRDFVVLPDPRPGMDPDVHKAIRTTISLQMTSSTGDVTNVEGAADFFVVREDSANVPPELEALVARPGVTWFIQRWEDETYQPGAAPAATTHPQPARRITLGAIKVRFLPLP